LAAAIRPPAGPEPPRGARRHAPVRRTSAPRADRRAKGALCRRRHRVG